MSCASLDKRLARQVLEGDGSVEAALSLFEYREPRSFDDALELVTAHGDPTRAAGRALSGACGCRIDLSTDPPEGHRQWLRTPKADYCRRCRPGEPGGAARPTVPCEGRGWQLARRRMRG